jgi:hypothetical protein
MKNKHRVILAANLPLLVLTFNRNKLYLQLKRVGSTAYGATLQQLSVQGAVDRREFDNVLITCLSLAADWGGPAGVHPVIADTKKEEEEMSLLAFSVCFMKSVLNMKENLTYPKNLIYHSNFIIIKKMYKTTDTVTRIAGVTM